MLLRILIGNIRVEKQNILYIILIISLLNSVYHNAMKTFRLIISLLVMAGLVACHSEVTDSQHVLFPNVSVLDKTNSETKLSSLFEKYKIVKLETNDSCLIGGRKMKFVKHDSRYYVQSYNDVLIFDEEGQFQNRLSKVGNSPEEYPQLYDFDVVRSASSEIWVSTAGGIMIYDANTLSFKRKIVVDGHVNKFKYVNDETIILVTPDDEVFKVCDKTGKIRKKFMKKDLANAGNKIVQFTVYAEKVIYQLDETAEAVVYDINSDSFSVQPLIPLEGDLLTVKDNRDYYEQYGYTEQYQYVVQDFVRMSSVRTFNDKVLIVTKHPNGKDCLTVSDKGKSATYELRPSAHGLRNDILEATDCSFINTLICCESDSGFLFMIPASLSDKGEMDEVNPTLLDVAM